MSYSAYAFGVNQGPKKPLNKDSGPPVPHATGGPSTQITRDCDISATGNGAIGNGTTNVELSARSAEQKPGKQSAWRRYWYVLCVRGPVGIYGAVVFAFLLNYHIKRKAAGEGVVCSSEDCFYNYVTGEPWWIVGLVASLVSIVITIADFATPLLFHRPAPARNFVLFFDIAVMAMASAGAAMLAMSPGWNHRRSSGQSDMNPLFILLFLMIPLQLLMAAGGACVWCGRREPKLTTTVEKEARKNSNLYSWSRPKL